MNNLTMDLYEKLSRLQWLLQRQHLRSHAEYGPLGDPTRGQGRVLAMLKMKPEIGTRELSYLLDIRQQSLSELLNKLERGGYIVRIPSEADKRVMLVRLTEKGRNEQAVDRDFGGIFGCLSEEEQESFGEYLDRVIAVLEEQMRGEPDGEGEEEPFADYRRDPRFHEPPPRGPHPHAPPPHGPYPPAPPPPPRGPGPRDPRLVFLGGEPPRPDPFRPDDE
ncbi:MAG: winged helix DNA-binding protein [Firmicutes bacterium]|nr:winged helix DNA-binding protein [Bacillota bacterium]